MTWEMNFQSGNPDILSKYIFKILLDMVKISVLTSLTVHTFIVYSYKYVHADGRVSYPLCFIFSSPMGM